MPDIVLINCLPVDESTGCGWVIENSDSSGYIYQNGYKYDPSTGALLISGSNAIAVRSNGLGYDADGALCVNVEGVPSFFLGGLPFDGPGRLCVTANPPVAVTRGWPIDGLGRICMVGGTPPPPAGPMINRAFLTTVAPVSATSYVCLGQLYFGNSGTIAGFYSNKTTFLTEHPSLTLQTFAGSGAVGCTPVTTIPAYAGIASITISGPVPAINGVYSQSCGTEPYDYLFAGSSDFSVLVSIDIVFSTPVNSVGFNVENGNSNGYAVAFYDGATLLHSATRPNAAYPFGGFAGYSTASAPPATSRLLLEDGSNFLLEDGSLLLLE